jgi:hypothetical protein
MGLTVLAVIVVLVLAALVVWVGSPRGPRLDEVAHLREPRLVTLPPQKVLLVTATGDPKIVAGKAFGALLKTYFRLKGVPRGGPSFKAPRGRWPIGSDVPAEQWTGLYAIPVPDAVTEIPPTAASEGLDVRLATWEYGPVAEVLHVGSWASEAPTIARLREFIDRQGCTIAGEHEEEYLRGPGMLFAGDPGGYLTLIRYPVRTK